MKLGMFNRIFTGLAGRGQPRSRSTIHPRPMRLDMIHAADKTEHRLTKLSHRWINRQVEQMNHTIKDATVKRLHYGSHDHCAHT